MKNRFLVNLVAIIAAVFVSLGTACFASVAPPTTISMQNSMYAFQVWNNSGTNANQFCVKLTGVYSDALDFSGFYSYSAMPTVSDEVDGVMITWTLNTQTMPQRYMPGPEQMQQTGVFGFTFNRVVSVSDCQMYWANFDGENTTILDNIDDVWQDWVVSGDRINAVINNRTPMNTYVQRSGGCAPYQTSIYSIGNSFPMYLPIVIDPLTPIGPMEQLSFDFTQYLGSQSLYMFYTVYRSQYPTPGETPAIRFANAVNIASPSGSLTFTKYADITDSLVKPDVNSRVGMLGARVTASSYEDVTLNGITLYYWNNNSGQDIIGTVDVWIDSNANGILDPGEDINSIGSTTYSSSEPMTILLSPQVIPANGELNLLITYTFTESAEPGAEIGFSLGEAVAYGNTSRMQVPYTGLQIDSAQKVVAGKPISISAAKQLPIDPNTSTTDIVTLKNKIITADFQSTTGLAYMEESDRSAGIGVIIPQDNGGADIPLGTQVSVVGRLTLLNGTELVIEPITGINGSYMPVAPVSMNNKTTGGGAFGNQPAVVNNTLSYPAVEATGLSNVGMLVRTWGTVTGYGQIDVGGNTCDCAWIDDGSGLWDGLSEYPGIAVLKPTDWQGDLPTGTLAVTGILRAIPNQNGQAVRLLVPRSQSDTLSF